MEASEYFFMTIVLFWIAKDFYSFVFRKKINERIYRRTVEDTSFNKAECKCRK